MTYTVTRLVTNDSYAEIVNGTAVWTTHVLVYADELDAVRACSNNYQNIRVQSVSPEPTWERFSHGQRPTLPQV